jgi:hypothetical protein
MDIEASDAFYQIFCQEEGSKEAHNISCEGNTVEDKDKIFFLQFSNPFYTYIVHTMVMAL